MSKADALGASSAFSTAVSARSARSKLYNQAVGKALPDANSHLPVDAISQNPDNPRDHMRNLDDITQTAGEVGIVNGITIATIKAYLATRPGRADELDPGTHYIVVDGHRRLEAARRVGLKTIKVLVDDNLVATDESLLEAAFVANYHRENLSELEEANALQALVKYYGSQSKAARRLGIAQATISSKLSLLKLNPVLQADLAEGRRHVKHVRNLGKASPEQQVALADERAAEDERAKQQQAKQRAATPTAPALVSEQPDTAAPVAAPTEATFSSAPSVTVQMAPKGVPVPKPLVAVPDPRPEPEQQDAPSTTAAKDGPIKLDWRDGRGSMDIAFDRWTRAVQRRPALARYFELVGGPERMAADLAAAIDREERAALIEALKKTL